MRWIRKQKNSKYIQLDASFLKISQKMKKCKKMLTLKCFRKDINSFNIERMDYTFHFNYHHYMTFTKTKTNKKVIKWKGKCLRMRFEAMKIGIVTSQYLKHQVQVWKTINKIKKKKKKMFDTKYCFVLVVCFQIICY